MICFCIRFVAVFFFTRTNAASLEPMPPQLMQMVLRHVNTLLTDVNKKVATERKLLSQLDDGNKKDTLIQEQSKTNRTLIEHGIASTDHNLEVTDTIENSGKPADSDARTLQLLKSLGQFPKQTLSVPDAPEFEPDPFDDIIFTAPTTVVKPEDPLDQTPEKKAMLSFMKTNDVGYCYGSTIGFFSMVMEKPDDLLQDLVIAFEKTISRMAKANEFKCLDFLLTQRLQKFAVGTRLAPVLIIKGYAEVINRALESKDEDALSPGILEILLKYDHFFNDEEGNELLDSVVMLHYYSRNVENYAEHAVKLNKRFIDAELAPTKRLCGSYQLRTLIAEINQVYRFNFPNVNLRKLNTSNDLTLRLPFDRSYTLDKDSISQFLNVVHAFILTHQDLFMEFAKEHINSKEHQDYLSPQNVLGNNSNHKDSINFRTGRNLINKEH